MYLHNRIIEAIIWVTKYFVTPSSSKYNELTNINGRNLNMLNSIIVQTPNQDELNNMNSVVINNKQKFITLIGEKIIKGLDSILNFKLEA